MDDLEWRKYAALCNFCERDPECGLGSRHDGECGPGGPDAYTAVDYFSPPWGYYDVETAAPPWDFEPAEHEVDRFLAAQMGQARPDRETLRAVAQALPCPKCGSIQSECVTSTFAIGLHDLHTGRIEAADEWLTELAAKLKEDS